MPETEKSHENMDLESAIQGPQDSDSNSIPASLVEVTVTQPFELDDDEICLAIKEDEIPDAVLKAVILGLAEEQNSLKILRIK